MKINLLKSSNQKLKFILKSKSKQTEKCNHTTVKYIPQIRRNKKPLCSFPYVFSDIFFIIGFVKISRYKYKQCQIIRIRRKPVISKFHSAMITMSGNYNDNSDCRQKLELQIHPSVSINATQISTLFQNSTLLNF